MLQKPRLNTHRKKSFKRLLDELATAEDHKHGTEVMTNTSPTDGNDVLSHKLTNQKKNGLKNTAVDCNSNVAKPWQWTSKVLFDKM